jgi:hypothetical protein
MGPRVRFLMLVASAGAAAAALFGPAGAAAAPGTNGNITYGHGNMTDSVFTAPFPNTDTGTFVTEGSDPAYNGPGTWIYFQRTVSGNTDISKVKPDGSSLIQLTDDPRFEGQPSPFWDSKRVAYTAEVDGVDQIHVMNADGTGQEQITFGSTNNFLPNAAAPCLITFTGTVGGSQEIFLMNSDGSNQTQLTANPGADFGSSFFPNLQQIVFSSPAGGGIKLFTMNLDGSNQTQLTFTQGIHIDPVVSPDGSMIAYTHVEGGVARIVVIDASGQNPAAFTNGPSDFSPDWQARNPPGISQFDLNASPNKVLATLTTNEPVTATVEGTGKGPKVPTASLAIASKAKKFNLKPVTAEVQPDTPTTLKLKVPKKGKKALKKALKAGKKGKVTVTATATDELGDSSQATDKAKVKKKKKQQPLSDVTGQRLAPPSCPSGSK